MQMWLLFVSCLLCAHPAFGMVPEGMYCGMENCYEILKLEQDATKSQLRKAYRGLAMEYHPDKNPSPEAAGIFAKIANAYEVLSDEKQRKAYDYMLAHPDEFMVNYGMWMRNQYMPKSDLRYIVLGCIMTISIMQFLYKKQRYHNLTEAIKRTPNFKHRVDQLMEEEAKANGAKPATPAAKATGRVSKKAGKKASASVDQVVDESRRARAEQRAVEEVELVGCSPPKIEDNILYDIWVFPLTVCKGVHSRIRWVVKFNLLGHEYGEEEEDYLTRKALHLSAVRWASLDSDKQDELVNKELWIKENFVAYEKEMREQQKEAMAGSARAKQMRRWQKKMARGGGSSDNYNDD